jgi:carboxyl-terminal processing protease
MARFLTALLLAGFLLVPSPVQSAPADLTVLTEALELLRTRHWNSSLDFSPIIRAGLAGLDRALTRVGVAQRIEPIPEGEDTAATISVFGQRLDEAVRLAGGRATERDLLHAALRTMFQRVGGSHTAFLSPPALQMMQNSFRGQSYEGIGIVLSRADAHWIFAEVAPRGPAAQAGVRRGDLVLSVDDIPVSELPVDEVQFLILGRSGTQVRLTLQRGQVEVRVTVARAAVTWPVAEGRMVDERIGYLRVYSFPDGAAARVWAEARRILAMSPSGFVVDLRSNPGGRERDGLAALGLFVPPGTRAFQDIDRAGRVVFKATTDVPLAPEIPLVVLINRHTASMGEVVAAAFKETGRATLIGERTVGAVEYGVLFGLSDGSGAWIATTRTLTAQGRELEGQGVTPDMEVAHDLAAERDHLLDQAIQFLRQRPRSCAGLAA